LLVVWANQLNQHNQLNQIDQANQADQLATRRPNRAPT
jgi:hypothetical protein